MGKQKLITKLELTDEVKRMTFQQKIKSGDKISAWKKLVYVKNKKIIVAKMKQGG